MARRLLIRAANDGPKRRSPLRTRPLLAALIALAMWPAPAGYAAFPNPVSAPDGKGDQVIFYYDARDDFATFINIGNDSAAELAVSIVFYSGDFSAAFPRTVSLPAGALAILDTHALKESGLPTGVGVAIATAVDASGAPIVSRGLSGNFTVANLRTNSAWGAAGAARSAIQKRTSPSPAPSPPPPDLGSVIDGSNVGLPPIQPASANLAAYYNPNTLAPAADGGNQLIFVTFEDVPGTPYVAKVASTTWTITANRSSGAPAGSASFVANGVTVSDLASLLGDGVRGSSGSAVLTASRASHPITRLVYFTESLGTFGTGYLLPRGRAAVDAPTPTPTP